MDLIHPREADVARARSDHGKVGHEGAERGQRGEGAHERGQHERANAAGRRHGKHVALKERAHLDRWACAIDVVVEDVICLVGPLPEERRSGALAHQQPRSDWHVGRHEHAHAPKDVHLLARRCMDDSTHNSLRVPHVRVAQARRHLTKLLVLSQLRLRCGEFHVRYQQRPHVDQLLNFREASLEGGLVVLFATKHE